MTLVVVLSGLVTSSFHKRVVAEEGPPPVLNPKSYTSPSGEYTLFVNPSDLYGRGGGSYRLTKGEREVWSGEKPFTLWEACVGDDGVTGGYAYSHGWRGFSDAGLDAGMGDFRVVIMDARGRERLDQVTKREFSNFPHAPPTPLAEGLFRDVAGDRMVIRVRDADVNRRTGSWWTYEVSTGKPLAPFRPGERMPGSGPARYLIDARRVAGTPLSLRQWWRHEEGKDERVGARFTLAGEDGEVVWSLDLPDDYQVPGDEEAEEQLRTSIRESGAILRADQDGRFELRFAKAAQRVTFAVARPEGGAWAVSEAGRRPYVEPGTPAPKPAEIPVRPLRLVGRIDLEAPAPGPAPAIRDVFGFEFDDRGRIALLRDGGGKAPALLVVDPRGDVLRTIPLDGAPEGEWRWYGPAWSGGDRFLLIRNNTTDAPNEEPWRVDVATAKAAPIAGVSCTVGSEVAGFPDGGFVIKGRLADAGDGAGDDDGLHAFDARGKRLWSLPARGDDNDPAALFHANDLTVTTGGVVAVVDVSRRLVQFFDRGGKHRRTVDLKRSWEWGPRYPSNLSADRDGGVVVQDFRGEWPLVRMGEDGAVRARVRPRLEDGRPFGLRDARVAPDGSLWVTDRYALYRLAESGVVDRVLGEAPDPRRLGEVDAVTLGRDGRIYAVDRRTGAVHVFGQDGRWLRVCVPGAGDVPDELSLPHLTVSDAGDVFLGLQGRESPRYLHFSPSGKRIGVEVLKLDNIQQDWYVHPKEGRRWVLGYEKVYLVDGAGAVLRTVDRRADGLWLERPAEASVAADGSIAVLSHEARMSGDGGPFAVSLYSPHGDPIRTFTLPPSVTWLFPRLAYDGELVVVSGGRDIVLFDTFGKAFGRFAPPQKEGGWWTPFLARAGREILLFGEGKTLYRFALP